MSNINEVMSQTARSGQLNIIYGTSLGGGYPIKVLAVIDGKTYEKDHTIIQTDMPFGILRQSLTSQLPWLNDDSRAMYSMSWIADEIIAYKTFEARKVSRLENVPDEEIDAMIKGFGCILCATKDNLKVCSGCKHVHYCSKYCQIKHWSGVNDMGRRAEWSHKKACKKLRGLPLRVNLDEIDFDKPLDDIGVDLTYGFVLVRRVAK